MNFIFIGNGARITLDVDDSETVASVHSKVCEALSMNQSGAVLIANNAKLLDGAAIFTKCVAPGIPIIVSVEEEEEEEEEEELLDFDMDGLDDPADSDPEIPQYSPEDIKDMIGQLKELGNFSDEQCEKALRVSYFNINRAAAFLLSSEVPDKPEMYSYKSLDDESAMSLEEKEKLVLRRLFDQTKVDMPILIQYYFACDRNEELTLKCVRSEKNRMTKEQSLDNFSDDFE